MRSDLRDATCAECGARCIPGQSHLEHNAGWRKNVLSWDWYKIQADGYPGWDLVDSVEGGRPPLVRLTIKNKVDRSSEDISKEFDDVAVGRFYWRDWSQSGSVFVEPGELYESGWCFQKRQDAYEFVRRYGGRAG
jgi:hypothetical protein